MKKEWFPFVRFYGELSGSLSERFPEFWVVVFSIGVEWVESASLVAGAISVVLNALELVAIVQKEAWSSEQKNEENDGLIDGMSENVSSHNTGNNWVVLLVWLSVQNSWGWWFGGKSKSGKGIHDKVDPKHLNGIEWSLFSDDGTCEYNTHGNEVYGKLKLEEFSDIVINISSVFQSNNN